MEPRSSRTGGKVGKRLKTKALKCTDTTWWHIFTKVQEQLLRCKWKSVTLANKTNKCANWAT